MNFHRLASLARKAARGWSGAEYGLISDPRVFPIDWRERSTSADADGAVRVTSPAGPYVHPVESAFRIIALHQTLELTLIHERPPDTHVQLERTAHALMNSQSRDGSFRYPVGVPRYATPPGWSSGMAQGLVFYSLTATQPHLSPETADRARSCAGRALDHLLLSIEDGGCSDYDDLGRPFFQECPSDPSSYILNGAAFAILGLQVSGSEAAQRAAGQAALRLGEMLPQWDLGYWSRYDLFDRTPSSPDYHSLHVTLLRALGQCYPTQPFSAAADRMAEQRARRSNRAHAFASLIAHRATDVLHSPERRRARG